MFLSQHQVTRLDQEKELLTRQIADLNAELTEKNHEIHTLKREKANNLLDLKTQLENRADEVCIFIYDLMLVLNSVKPVYNGILL